MAGETAVATAGAQDTTQGSTPDPNEVRDDGLTAVERARQTGANASLDPQTPRDVPHSPTLDAYMSDVRRHYGGEAEPAKEGGWDGQAAPGATDGTTDGENAGTETETPGTPATEVPDSDEDLDYDKLARHPKIAPRLQSEIDKRANALYQAQKRKEQAEGDQAKRAQQQKDEAAELEKLAELAMEDDPFVPDGYNDEATVRKHNEIVQARTALRERKEVQRLHTQWENEHLPQLYDWVKNTEVSQLASALEAQYDEGYAAIPELQQDPSLAARVRHTNFEHAGQWLLDLTDSVTGVRVRQALEAERERLAQDNERQIAVRAKAEAERQMAEFRGRLPNMDLSPEPSGDGSTGVFKTQAEVHTANVQGRLRHLSSYQIRALLNSLPEGDLGVGA